MNKTLLGLILLAGATTFACQSDEEARQEDQAQEQRNEDVKDSVLNAAQDSGFWDNDSNAAPVKEDTAKNNPSKKY
jgi:hypothetical protein